jgi:hypothetical protein
LIEKAAGRTATASSVQGAGWEAAKAVDADATTSRWSSSFADNQWWQVDLGAVRNVQRVVLKWYGNSWGPSYQIQTSTDGVNFTTVATDGVTSAVTKTTDFTPTQARYVRVQGAKRAASYGISFTDAKVFGLLD